MYEHIYGKHNNVLVPVSSSNVGLPVPKYTRGMRLFVQRVVLLRRFQKWFVFMHLAPGHLCTGKPRLMSLLFSQHASVYSLTGKGTAMEAAAAGDAVQLD